MARAETLKKLFRSYKCGNDAAFIEAANEIIEEERKKHHVLLASELAKLVHNGRQLNIAEVKNALEPLPKDSDRGAALLEIRTPDRFFEDLILADEPRGILLNTVEEFKHWEILEANGLRPSSRLLFCGPPGCGKTAMAEALSAELAIPLLYVRFDAVVSSLLGETAANLRKVFDYASKGTWVLFFDEFDAIGRSRDDVTEHGEIKRVVNTFLQMLDRFAGRTMVIAATNFEQSLDPALWRRFDEIVRFEKPSAKEIEQLVRKKLRNEFLWPKDLNSTLAKLRGLSHAEIERICLDMMKWVAIEGRTTTDVRDLDRAIRKQIQRKQALLRSQSKGQPAVDAG